MRFQSVQNLRFQIIPGLRWLKIVLFSVNLKGVGEARNPWNTLFCVFSLGSVPHGGMPNVLSHVGSMTFRTTEETRH